MSATQAETPTTDPRAAADFGWLIGSGLVFAALLAGPAWWVAESRGLIGLAVSAALCLVPGCVALVLTVWGGPGVSLMFLSSGLRLGFVLTGSLVAKFLVTGYGMREFFVWLIVFYLFTLAVETWLAMRRNFSTTSSPSSPAS